LPAHDDALTKGWPKVNSNPVVDAGKACFHTCFELNASFPGIINVKGSIIPLNGLKLASTVLNQLKPQRRDVWGLHNRVAMLRTQHRIRKVRVHDKTRREDLTNLDRAGEAHTIDIHETRSAWGVLLLLFEVARRGTVRGPLRLHTHLPGLLNGGGIDRRVNHTWSERFYLLLLWKGNWGDPVHDPLNPPINHPHGGFRGLVILTLQQGVSNVLNNLAKIASLDGVKNAREVEGITLWEVGLPKSVHDQVPPQRVLFEGHVHRVATTGRQLIRLR
jgi:hypothetical protein